MTSDDRPARNAAWPNGRPTKSLYDLPETLDILKEYRCTRKDLAQYLFDGELRAIGFPYRLEPDRAVNYEPSLFKRVWKDPWAFPIYDNYQGDEYLGDEPDSGRHTMPKVPLDMVPDAVDEETRMLGEDGKPIATSATVYIRHEALKRFVYHQFPEADGRHIIAKTPDAVSGGLTRDARSKPHSHSIIAAETKFKVWLQKLDPKKVWSKPDLLAEAQKRFAGLSERGFLRVWNVLAPDAWKRPGRKS